MKGPLYLKFLPNALCQSSICKIILSSVLPAWFSFFPNIGDSMRVPETDLLVGKNKPKTLQIQFEQEPHFQHLFMLYLFL